MEASIEHFSRVNVSRVVMKISPPMLSFTVREGRRMGAGVRGVVCESIWEPGSITVAYDHAKGSEQGCLFFYNRITSRGTDFSRRQCELLD